MTKVEQGQGQSFWNCSVTPRGMGALQQGRSPLSHHLSNVPGIATVSSSGWSGCRHYGQPEFMLRRASCGS